MSILGFRQTIRYATGLSAMCALALCQSKSDRAFRREIPKTWDERALADWATPVAGLNVRPGHFSEQEYYAAPIDNLRTYPVYYPGREPAGYLGDAPEGWSKAPHRARKAEERSGLDRGWTTCL
jgi:hypothetical protein